MRQRNTNSEGRPWTREQIDAVWNKGKVISGHDPGMLRMDECGAWISYDDYGKSVEKGEGWEIDHIQPVVQGGTDHITNLRPFQWQNNRYKGDDWPNWKCLVSSDYVGPLTLRKDRSGKPQLSDPSSNG